MKTIWVHIDELLSRWENLGDGHCVRHKLVSDLLKLVVSESMVCGGREVPTALLDSDDDRLSFILIKAGTINAVLVLDLHLLDFERERQREWFLVLL